jgi:hypothetical protein
MAQDADAVDDDPAIVPLHMDGDNNILTFGRMRPSRKLSASSFSMNYLDRSVEWVRRAIL